MLEIYPKYHKVFKCVTNLAANIAKALNVLRLETSPPIILKALISALQISSQILRRLGMRGEACHKYNRLLGMRYYLSITWHPPLRKMWRYFFYLRGALLWRTLVGEAICREIMFFSLRGESSEVL